MKRPPVVSTLVLVLWLSSAGCGNDAECIVDSDCELSERCEAQRCTSLDGGGASPADASGSADGGSLDADLGAVDAGGVPDAAAEPDAVAEQDAGMARWTPPPIDVALPRTVSDRLRCSVEFAAPLNGSAKVGRIGTDVTSVVGIDPEAAGIGAVFELKNNASPHFVNVVESRSGAGAAWQTSSLVWDHDGGAGIIVFNQSAGNSVGSQWMYRTSTSVTDGRSMETLEWTPVVSDHIHLQPGGHSPCNGSGYVFDDMKQDIVVHGVPTAHGRAILWQNVVTYRSRVDQNWPQWKAEQALYLSRRIARAGRLRIYFARAGRITGPVRPYDPGFTIAGESCRRSGSGTSCNTRGYDYVVLVWNIHGLDVGVAVDDVPETALNLETQVYCADASNDACGNINYHTWFAVERPAVYPQGSVRTYYKNYYVGTLEQLAALGFSITS